MRQHPPELLDPARSGRLEIRACQCPFCTRHGSRAAADPNGRLTISVEDRAKLQTYRFGLRTADYLVCRECGVYVAAIAGDGAEARAIVIVNALDDREQFSREPIPVRYDAETREQRLARRRSACMPVEIQGI
ncbi:aldehyde-activating protein [Mesorhizobium sp.]|uniref:aldehyde-activating protein n=1 Tax=Mesorhizobium sp. TaxID=1871066 RepID=UPI000FE39DA2|nr:aldehyde-activating protein [Mesorhizobium sp.]RWG91218.1 MAG: aldehyde-activating protein [Mesorhizobium sp.]RWK22196.1 MAG: aldehyde-activating protein [Mesorhizobium sp.]TIQ52035.1 MAG: aldehyde-activating protein [Mesorhizobium sp.]TIQ60680.1 MAG: aldehyde-activating protein [Mesorhizobium sp.]